LTVWHPVPTATAIARSCRIAPAASHVVDAVVVLVNAARCRYYHSRRRHRQRSHSHRRRQCRTVAIVSTTWASASPVVIKSSNDPFLSAISAKFPWVRPSATARNATRTREHLPIALANIASRGGGGRRRRRRNATGCSRTQRYGCSRREVLMQHINTDFCQGVSTMCPSVTS
jgi:hypothetical protein